MARQTPNATRKHLNPPTQPATPAPEPSAAATRSLRSSPGASLPRQAWFTLLGPVRAWRGPVELDLGPPQQRATLAALLLREGAQASVDELIDAVWGAEAPRSAEKTIRTYVYRLRRVVAPEDPAAEPVISTVGNGYVMRVSAEDYDLGTFRCEVAAATAAQRAGNDADAAAHLRSALALWQGTPLAGVTGTYADLQRASLHNLHRSTLEARLDADFRQGEYQQAVVELTSIVADNPLDERFRELLMTGLYRSGRQAEALANYRQAQTVLADELGIDPGPGLRTLYERILRADPELLTPAPEPATPREDAATATTPAQLPATPANFAGRETELATLDRILPETGAPTTVLTMLLTGMAGVGKTTLALHWAHRIAHRFPDGQLYLNLRGFEPTGSAMTPTEAVRALLESLGVPAQAVPAGLDAQTALYRSLLAGRRVLVLADNAGDADQVRPLLPGTPGCLVVVTSRNHLTSLIAVDGAQQVNLDHLRDDEAGEVLANRLGAGRLAAEPEAARKIIERCSGLPLALAVVAARAAINPHFPLAAIADELAENQDGLDAFTISDTTVDVRDVFSWSYRALDEPAARLFRLLGLHPGPDVDVTAAASLVGLTTRQTRTLLTTLVRAHLVTEHLPGRYSWHDLLHAYAIELLGSHEDEVDRVAAVSRLFDHYVHTAHACALLFSPHRDPLALDRPTQGTLVREVADADRAGAWFDAEHVVLLAVIRAAAAVRCDRHAWQLAWAVEHFLDRRGHWHDLLDTQRTALAAAVRSADDAGQARAHGGLARAHCDLGQFDEGRVHLERALALFAALGDDRSMGNTHRSFSWVLEQQGDYDSALEHAQRSAELHRAIGDRHGEAASFNAIGWYHALTGRNEEALSHCRQALAILAALGDRYGQADTWDSIGLAHHGLGEHRQAADAFGHAIDLYRELGVDFAEGDTSVRLADAHLAAGDEPAARQALERALELFEQLSHPLAEQVRARLRQSAQVSSPRTAP